MLEFTYSSRGPGKPRVVLLFLANTVSDVFTRHPIASRFSKEDPFAG